jgi:flagellar hook-associated protein 2
MAGSVSGLVSGLDTDAIIAKMLEYGQKPIKLLQNKQTTYTDQLTAWQDFNTRLLALRTKAGALSNSYNFKDKTATSSDTSSLTVSAYTDAVVGTYTISVDRLAQAEQIQSQGYADLDTTTIGTGKLTVGVGDAAKEITIDTTNNTLSGLKDAINRAGVGVTASIVDLAL